MYISSAVLLPAVLIDYLPAVGVWVRQHRVPHFAGGIGIVAFSDPPELLKGDEAPMADYHYSLVSDAVFLLDHPIANPFLIKQLSS